MKRGSFKYRYRYMHFDDVETADGYILEENGFAIGVCKRGRKWWAYELGCGLSVSKAKDTRNECVADAKLWADTTSFTKDNEKYIALCNEFAGKGGRVFTGTVIS